MLRAEGGSVCGGRVLCNDYTLRVWILAGAVSLRCVSSRPASARAVLGDEGGRARESAAGVLSISHGPRTALALRHPVVRPSHAQFILVFIAQGPCRCERMKCLCPQSSVQAYKDWGLHESTRWMLPQSFAAFYALSRSMPSPCSSH